ncbi:hypothetical protein [Streptomyces yaizuensis]|uniref:Uncharacterized protein n=1 Tax=Streptomyces yaizuensis TaxID=2989713 RepID=A0ABQ5P2H2_9ACTN|nr:hypothetical protein [Streptomyces sp. YSPA8]GLF96653.1 hypothetical protein SYYSPA8_20170 [Streptomyces sp. YSPA8]
MTPGLRTRCALAVGSVLLLGAPGTAAAHDEPGAPAPARPTPSASLAGHPAGEGRTRPGRPPATGSPWPARESGASRSSGGPTEPADPTAATPSATVSMSQSRPGSASGPPTPGASRTPGSSPPGDDGTAPGNRAGDDVPADADDPWGARDAGGDPQPTFTPLDPGAARQQGYEGPPEPVPHRISPLSLGIGMALMGLGIGFLGIRMRRR